MRPRRALVAALIAAVVGASATPAYAAPAPKFDHLDPGGKPALTETVPVNIVFLGYDRAEVDRAKFMNGLARTSRPVNQSATAYGVSEDIGITYTYDYRVTYADRAYTDRFFQRLGQLAEKAPLTEYQKQYNDQHKNVLDVTDNHVIDAPAVERYLAYNPPAGVDTERNTIFLIDWYGRADFKFHLYGKTGEPDPDTGVDFGRDRDSRKLMAWGGTPRDDRESGLGSTRRVWFADLSAGPEPFMANHIVDRQDVDGDRRADYRMPVSWEYRADGFRAPGKIPGDLAMIVRYVGLNALMTTSPLYPVDLPSATGLPKTVDLDVNTYEGWPGVDASATYLKPDIVVEKIQDLRRRTTFSHDLQDLPLTGKALECYQKSFGDRAGPCYPGQRLDAAANLYLNAVENDRTFRDDAGLVDYEMPFINYASGVDYDPDLTQGYADDNWTDGTQSYVYSFTSPGVVEQGYGLTTTMVHEGGHHLGLAHPHDGYDSETGVGYEATGDYYFAWLGDQSNTVMSYIDLNWDFSQFDRDNSNRFLAAAYVEGANRLAADVLRTGKAVASLANADARIGEVEQAFANHDYQYAYDLAEDAYAIVVRAAGKAGTDPAAAAKVLHTKAEQARIAGEAHEGDEFIDTLEPGYSPRSLP